jgi:hypothetical protein
MMLRSGRAKAGERLYIIGDDRFSAEGNALVAREVEERLR